MKKFEAKGKLKRRFQNKNRIFHHPHRPFGNHQVETTKKKA